MPIQPRRAGAIPMSHGRLDDGRDAAGTGVGPGLPRVRKPALVRHLGAVDVAELRAYVERLPERVWRQCDAAKENKFPCFVHARHIVFRFTPGNRTPLRFYSTLIGEAWQRLLLPVMAQAAAPYGYARPVYPKAMLARLVADGHIARHRDDEATEAAAFAHKIHVPLQTNSRATLTVGDTGFHLEAGHAWEINNLAPHGAFNGGVHDRVHFIFEVFDGSRAAESVDFVRRHTHEAAA